MTVALLLITHNHIGTELLHTATRMLGHCPLTATALAVCEHDQPERLYQQAQAAADASDDGSGVLIVTDLFGSTPANIATAAYPGHRVEVLTGVNLPMVVRIFNYAQLDLAALRDKALTGGCDGVFHCQPAPSAPPPPT